MSFDFANISIWILQLEFLNKNLAALSSQFQNVIKWCSVPCTRLLLRYKGLSRGAHLPTERLSSASDGQEEAGEDRRAADEEAQIARKNKYQEQYGERRAERVAEPPGSE